MCQGLNSLYWEWSSHLCSNRTPYNRYIYINPFYWVDDHPSPIIYGSNGVSTLAHMEWRENMSKKNCSALFGGAKCHHSGSPASEHCAQLTLDFSPAMFFVFRSDRWKRSLLRPIFITDMEVESTSIFAQFFRVFRSGVSDVFIAIYVAPGAFQNKHKSQTQP